MPPRTRLPGTPKAVWVSGWCASGAHVGEKFFRGEGYPICKYEYPNPSWEKSIKCGCSCHWAEHGKLENKEQQRGARPDLLPKPPPPPREVVLTENGTRPKGALEQDVKRICDDYIMGTVKLKEGRTLTPDMVAAIIEQDTGKKPSSGAIDALFSRWLEIGFAVILSHPKRFEDYTDQGREQGLAALKEAAAARKRAERLR